MAEEGKAEEEAGLVLANGLPFRENEIRLRLKRPTSPAQL